MWRWWRGWDQIGILDLKKIFVGSFDGVRSSYRYLEDARTRSGRRLVALFQRFCRFKSDGGGSYTVGGGGWVVDGSSSDGNVLLRFSFPLRGKLKSLLGRGGRLVAPAREMVLSNFCDAIALPEGRAINSSSRRKPAKMCK